MYDQVSFFKFNKTTILVSFPHELNEIINDWNELRKCMLKKMPKEFTRDEWAYLITFLDKENLNGIFLLTFGKETPSITGKARLLLKPLGDVSVWLPNNVSMLGPLMLVLLTLTGNNVHIKAGTRSENLTVIFRDYILNNLSAGVLRTIMAQSITIEEFDRNDDRNIAMARCAKTRIVFSSDETAMAIESLPHPVDSHGIYFTDKQSEVWAEIDAVDDFAVETLIKVFTIFGQSGCTSPRRVILINGDEKSAIYFKKRIVDLWPRDMSRDIPQHIASENIMCWQWAKALGWDVALTYNNSSVIAAGNINLPECKSHMFLPIVWANRSDLSSLLPANIQTVGHCLNDPFDISWLNIISESNVKRYVPIRKMHHFGPVWDGYAFFRQLFEEVEILE